MTEPDAYWPDTAVNYQPGFAYFAGQQQSDYEAILGGNWASTVGPMSAICYLLQELPFMSGLGQLGAGSGFGAMGDLFFGVQTFADMLCGMLTGGFMAAGPDGAMRTADPVVGTSPQTVLNGVQAVNDTAVVNPYYNTVMSAGGGQTGNAVVDAINGGTAVADDASAYAGSPEGLGTGTVSGQIPNENVSGIQGSDNIGASHQMLVDSMVQPLFSVWGTGYGLADVSDGIGQTKVDVAATTTVAQNTSSIQMGRAVTKPTYNATDPTADAVFPISSINGSTPTFVDVTAGESVIGMITTPDAGVKKTIIWHGQHTTGITGLYLNVYKMNKTTGVLTRLSNSANLIGDVTDQLSWEYYNLPQAAWITAAHGDVYAIEMVVTGSGTYQVVGMPSHWASSNTNVFPRQMGATRAPVIQPTFGSIGGGYSNNGNVSSFNFTHNIASDDTLIAVCVGTAQISNMTVSAYVGGQIMSSYDYEYYVGLGYYEDMAVLLLSNPPTGVQTISVYLSAAGPVSANSVTYKNASGWAGGSTNYGTANPMAHTFTGAATTSRILQVFAWFPGGGAAGAYNQTNRWTIAGSSGGRPGLLIGDAPGAASVAFSANNAGGDVWGSMAIPILGAASSPATINDVTYSPHVPWFAIGGAAGAAQTAPQTMKYATVGTYTYNVPGFANHVDVVALGGGGGPGTAMFDGAAGSASSATVGGTTVTGSGGAGGAAGRGGDGIGYGPGNDTFDSIVYYGGANVAPGSSGAVPGGGAGAGHSILGYYRAGHPGTWAAQTFATTGISSISVTVGGGGQGSGGDRNGAPGCVWIRAYQ